MTLNDSYIPDDDEEQISALEKLNNRDTWLSSRLRILSLQGKLILSFTLLVVIALSVFTMLMLDTLQQDNDQASQIEARQTTSLLASLVTAAEIAEPSKNLEGVLEQIKSTTRAIGQIVIYDAAGKPVADTMKNADATPINPAEHANAGVQRDGDLNTITPIRADASRAPLGFVGVFLSPEKADQNIDALTRSATKLGLLLIMCSSALATLLIRRNLLPIRALVVAARQIAAGDLDTRVATNRPDAIGDLARAINEITRTVKKQQTALRKANEQFAKANQELESKVDQRTSQFETANKRLSAEIAEKEDFLRAVSHDLNAPLRNISGMVTMLLMKKKDTLEADVLQRLERVKKNVEIETDLINELLELSRIKTRRQAMEQVDIEAMLWELRGMFENDLKTRNIELIVDTILPSLYCEKARVRQIFQNLVDNAIKYMGDGEGKQIHVGCQIRLSEAEFYVRDTGLGIDEEDIGKVFFVFRRGKNTAAQNIAGKGVGLASVKSIIETYSGKIWVESQLGTGSTFRFTINGQYVPATGGGKRRDEIVDPEAVAA